MTPRPLSYVQSIGLDRCVLGCFSWRYSTMAVCVEAPMCLFCPHTVLQDSSGVGFLTAKAILVLSQQIVRIHLLTHYLVY